MENRKKFYSSNDTIQERYEKICGVLGAYKKGYLDKQDLTFAIKNAFVSKIYVSCEVVKALSPDLLPNDLKELYLKLINDGVLDLMGNGTGPLMASYLSICEIGTVVSRLRKTHPTMPHLRIEHVIPGEVYLNKVIDLFDKNTFTFDEFIKIFKVVSICIVTDKENKELDKGLRNSMPSGNGDFLSDPFARYKEKDIKIWRLCY